MKPAATIQIGDFVMFTDYLGDELGVVVAVNEEKVADLPNSYGNWYKVVWCTNSDVGLELFHETALLEWKERYEEWKISNIA